MISQHLADVLSFVFGISLMALAISFVIKFYIRTAIIVQKIHSACRAEGSQWKFWGDTEQLIFFALMPDKLINQNDSERITKEKQTLIVHRKSMWRTIYLCWAIMGAAFISIVTIQLLSS